MHLKLQFAALVFPALLAIPVLLRDGKMTENQNYLKEARRQIVEFESHAESEKLTAAYTSLENVVLAQEDDPKKRAQLRADCLSTWLHLLQLLDRSLDPAFDPKDVPEKLVQPPPSPDGSVLRPGANPALIQDPKARAEYEIAIAANRQKAQNYRLQIGLRRLNERLPQRAESFIRISYTALPNDQMELRAAIEKASLDSKRKTQLLRLLIPPQQ
jgi:hypothetical protein